jgi:hypothetical protein
MLNAQCSISMLNAQWQKRDRLGIPFGIEHLSFAAGIQHLAFSIQH